MAGVCWLHSRLRSCRGRGIAGLCWLHYRLSLCKGEGGCDFKLRSL